MLGQAKGGTMKQTIGAANPLWGPILTSSSTLNYSSSSHARGGGRNKVLTLSSSSFALFSSSSPRPSLLLFCPSLLFPSVCHSIFFLSLFFSFVFISWQTPRIFLFWTNSSSSSRDVVSPFIFSCEAAGFSLVCFFLSENSMLRACVGSALFYFRLGFLFPLDWQLFFPSSSFFLLLFLDFFCLCIYIKNWCTAAKTLSLSLSLSRRLIRLPTREGSTSTPFASACCSQPQNTHSSSLSLKMNIFFFFSSCHRLIVFFFFYCASSISWCLFLSFSLFLSRSSFGSLRWRFYKPRYCRLALSSALKSRIHAIRLRVKKKRRK